MIKTKLILVDGITGSGKSTISHFIARQMQKNLIKVKWFHEDERKHPLRLYGEKYLRNKEESDIDYSRRIMIDYYSIWQNFIKKIKDDDIVYIVESFIFQDILFFPHFIYDIDRKKIKEFDHDVMDIIRSLDPVVIHFYQNDVELALKSNWKARGKSWSKSLIRSFGECQYCKNRHLKGESGVISLLKDFSDLTIELYNECNFRKIQIENSSHDWDKYRQQICDFLGIDNFQEEQDYKPFWNFCGDYLGQGFICKIFQESGYLYMDGFWQGLKLLPITKNEVEVEGYPLRLKFSKKNEVESFQFVEALSYYTEGSIAKKYLPITLNEKQLNVFCQNYWCESEKLSRKIYLKHGELYYWRGRNNETRLIPVSEMQLMMLNDMDNRLEFKLVNNQWQFTLKMKGDEPSNLHFVPKNTSKRK